MGQHAAIRRQQRSPYLVKFSEVSYHNFSIRFENRKSEEEVESGPKVIGEEDFPQLDGILEGELPLVRGEEPTISEEQI